MPTASVRKKGLAKPVPTLFDWRTTDEDEIQRRRDRALTESFQIINKDTAHPIFSNFRVHSGSGLVYSVEIRDLKQRLFACDCVDFRVNGLGTCKHVEAVLLQLQARFKKKFDQIQNLGSSGLDIVPDYEKGLLRLECYGGKPPAALAEWFDNRGLLLDENPESAVEQLRQLNFPALRVSQEVEPWLCSRMQAQERKRLRRDYEQKVRTGEWPPQETLVPLFPYQREGMLHLAFNERALLADEMGLGKTIQAIAACALLHRLGKASSVLVVTPASLKTEWEEQIQKFTTLPCQLVFGARPARLQAYAQNIFFTIVNYEQMLADALDVNERLKPDVVILDEAQRIKNWNTKTAQAVKRLRSRYAFVLTGTPIENRIDELHSLMDFLNPGVLGPLFRFNREYYVLDDRGRPAGYRNLNLLHERIKPYMIRRRKADVEPELPERTDRTHFVSLSNEQMNRYSDHEQNVLRLMSAAKRRQLTQQELDKLMREMAMMRMVCDTNYILNAEEKECPKLVELQKILEECRDNPDVKVIVFSEWERMLMLVREACDEMEMGYAWHTGAVPQRRRRAEINLFKNDPNCRVFLTTDSGSTGLNLQNASVVVNCDLPWNPAKLEQRIARAWRKNQTRPVTVIHLVSENTIEHKMISTLASKQALSDGILDLRGDLDSIKMGGGRQAFLAKLEQLIAPASLMNKPANKPKPLPADRAKAFSEIAAEKINGALVRCEERYPGSGAHSVLLLVVERDAAVWKERLASLHQEFFGPGVSDPLSPVQFEVIDRATDEALKRMMESGLIGIAARASRPLYPLSECPAPPALSAEERQKANAYRAQAAKKWKMGRILAKAGMPEEARQALLEAVHAAGRSLAAEHRLAEPATLDEALKAPLHQHFGEALASLRIFVADAASAWEPAADALKNWIEPL